MTVRVTGFGRAVRMALEEVLERMEVMYQRPQSIYGVSIIFLLSHPESF
jgi:hypothetical protein